MIGKILVLGSSNVDFILKVPRFHQPGETIRAQNPVTAFGGKGANQAMAARRLGGAVTFLTKLGTDGYGESYARYLVRHGFRRRGLLHAPKISTGMAFIELTPAGENRIIVSPGANAAWTRAELDGFSRLWAGTRVFVAQLEIPVPAVHRALQIAREHGALTLLNPAPAAPLSPALLRLVDFLVPNEMEARTLSGMETKGRGDIPGMAAKLLGQGVKHVVITLGAKGLYFKDREGEMWMPAFRVRAVDTTAAGDAFLGALAVGLCRKRPVPEALRWASAAGALATTRMGAQPSLPRRDEVVRFLRRQPSSKVPGARAPKESGKKQEEMEGVHG